MTYLQVGINNKVFVFDVTVSDPLAIQIVDRLDDLRKHISSLVLRKALVLALFNALEQVV